MTATGNKRRIISFISVLVMVLSLCACSSPNLSVNQSIKEGKQKLTSVENCHLVLQITINPQLVFYLDETGTVLKADAGNKDGESLLAAVELTGLSYEDAVNAVFSAAAELDLLPENAKVQIDVLASASGPLSLEQTQQLEQAVAGYSEDQTAAVDQSIVVAENCGADQVQVENMENGDVFYSYFSDRERIREICYGADGSYHEWVYENKQTVYTLTVNPDGTRQEEHCSYENGHLVYHSVQSPHGFEENTYYSDGTQKSHKVVGDDGFVEEQQFYENGNPKTIKTVWGDGPYAEQYFNENGIITYSCETRIDGSRMETYYYANGNPKTSLDILADGAVQERQYHENGNISFSRDTFPDGSVVEQYYDEAGNRIEN